MSRAIGVLAADHIAVGLVEDKELVGTRRVFPGDEEGAYYLAEMPVEEIVEGIAQQIEAVCAGSQIDAVGVGFPGIIEDGLVADSPNLQQAKGHNLAEDLRVALAARNINAPVHAHNDADAMAAGIAARFGLLNQFIRVWTLGVGVGYGRYPQMPGAGEGGHCVVSLDTREAFCHCGGVGHLEGIMGYTAMRRRFLDLEPEEVFEHANQGDERCCEFVKLWHRALAAATANSVHMVGPGKFFLSGPSAKYVQTGMLDLYMHQMVKMSPLQDSTFEVVSTGDDVGIIGAAICAALATTSS